MVVYKVYNKNYDLKKAEPMGMLIERRKDLRGMNQVESGIKWAKSAFGHLVKNKQTIFVVPDEWDLGTDDRVRMEKEIFTKEEFLEIMKAMDQETKEKRRERMSEATYKLKIFLWKDQSFEEALALIGDNLI